MLTVVGSLETAGKLKSSEKVLDGEKLCGLNFWESVAKPELLEKTSSALLAGAESATGLSEKTNEGFGSPGGLITENASRVESSESLFSRVVVGGVNSLEGLTGELLTWACSTGTASCRTAARLAPVEEKFSG